MLLAKGGSNIRLFKDETSFYVYIYKSTWSRTNIEVFSDNHSKFYFTDVTDQISISDGRNLYILKNIAVYSDIYYLCTAHGVVHIRIGWNRLVPDHPFFYTQDTVHQLSQ